MGHLTFVRPFRFGTPCDFGVQVLYRVWFQCAWRKCEFLSCIANTRRLGAEAHPPRTAKWWVVSHAFKVNVCNAHISSKPRAGKCEAVRLLDKSTSLLCIEPSEARCEVSSNLQEAVGHPGFRRRAHIHGNPMPGKAVTMQNLIVRVSTSAMPGGVRDEERGHRRLR